jgi:hypothetical protein
MPTKFPTGKPHVSFSEVKAWAECPFRHYLMYVEKINTYNDNPYADFGTEIHNAIEGFLKGKAFSLDDINKKLDEIWEKGGYDTQEYIEGVAADRASNGWKYTHETLDDYKSSAKTIISDFETFMNKSFPGWEPLSAEVELYEPLNEDLRFKGFIDCVIAKPKKPGSDEVEYWVIDWKTTGKTGWFWKKKREFISLAQVGLYKHYWATKFNIPEKDIRAAYVFLKRGAKPGKSIELFEVSAGPKFIEKTNKLVKRMIKNVSNGIKLKNYDNCTFCPYKGTEHCNGKGW